MFQYKEQNVFLNPQQGRESNGESEPGDTGTDQASPLLNWCCYSGEPDETKHVTDGITIIIAPLLLSVENVFFFQPV